MKKNISLRTIKNLSICAGTALGVSLGITAAASAGVRLFLKEAVDREEPQIMVRAKAKMLGTTDGDPLAEVSAAAARRLREAETERVEITARDGVKLVGHLRRCPNPKRYLVAFHGWRSAWYRDFGASADFWLENGCTVLYVEQRSMGESGGDYITFGIQERWDCLDWLLWMNRNGAEGKPLYPIGLSMGATTVLMASNLPLPKNVRGILADCGFTSAGAIWEHVARRDWHIPYDAIRPAVNRWCRKHLGCDPEAVTTTAALRGAKVPVLLVHGLDDNFVPPHMSEENYEACPVAGKRLLLVPGATHGMSYFMDRKAYERQVLEFWAEQETETAVSGESGEKPDSSEENYNL